jgi:hypothetical protein
VPRQDGGVNGWIGRYEIYVAASPDSWESPDTVGTFSDTASSVTFAPVTGRYLRLRVLTEAGSRGPWTSAAEITVPWSGGGRIVTAFRAVTGRPPRSSRYLTAPAVRPAWIWRWKMMYITIIGRIEMVSAANSPDQSAS